MPADNDVDNILKMRLEVTIVVLGDDLEHFCDRDEGVGNVRLLEEIASTKKSL